MAGREEYLSVAQELLRMDVPVFAAKRNPYYGLLRLDGELEDREYFYPKGWQEFKADPKFLDSWEPGDALCAVTGVIFDVIDVDVKTAGWHESLEMLKAQKAVPDCGCVRTPSMGLHYYVPRTGVRTMISAWPGIDFKAGDVNDMGRGFVFIPGTFRPRYNFKGYEPLEPIDWDKIISLDFKEYWNFMNLVVPMESERLPRVHGDGEFKGQYTREQCEEAVVRFMRVKDSLRRKSRTGNRNNELNKAAYLAGGLISGLGLDEGIATTELIKTGIALGLSRAEAESTIVSALKKGRFSPIYGGTTYPYHRRVTSDRQRYQS